MKDIKDKIIEAWATDKHQHIYSYEMRNFLNERLGIETQEDDSRAYLTELLVENLNRDTLGLYASSAFPKFGLSYKAIEKEFCVDEATIKSLVYDKKIFAEKWDYSQMNGISKAKVFSINICDVHSIKRAYNAGLLLPPLEVTEQTVADALYSIQSEIEDLFIHGTTEQDEKQQRDLERLKQRTLSRLLQTNNNIERLGLIPEGQKFKRFFGLQGYVFYFVVKDAPENEKENPLDRDLSKDPLRPAASMELIPAKYLLQEYIDSNIIV